MPSRRAFGLGAVTVVLSGCVGGPPAASGGTDGDRSPTAASSNPTRTDPTETNRPEGTSTASGTATSSETPAGMWQLGDFVLWNQHDADHDLTVRVERNGETLLDETRTLSAGASTRLDNPIAEPGTYRVTASTASGEAAAYEWTLECQGEAEYLQVVVTESGTLEIRQMNQTVTSPPC